MHRPAHAVNPVQKRGNLCHARLPGLARKMVVDHTMSLSQGKVIQPSWGKVQTVQIPKTGHLSACIIGEQGIVRTLPKKFDNEGEAPGLDLPTLIGAPTQKAGPQGIGYGKTALQERGTQPGLRRLCRVTFQRLPPCRQGNLREARRKRVIPQETEF